MYQKYLKGGGTEQSSPEGDGLGDGSKYVGVRCRDASRKIKASWN